MGEHSKYFSPSSISRRIACHGSARLEAEIVEEGPKPAADWGTFAHHISEQYLTGKIVYLNTWKKKEMFGQVCNDEMLECVRQYIADIKELNLNQPKFEQKLSLEWAGYPEVFGTADTVDDNPFSALTVVDLKTGTIEIDPNSEQLMLYALMAGGKELISLYDTVRLAISQPRGKDGGKSLKVWESSPATLYAWFMDVLEPAIIAINAGDNTLNPSEKSCKFCKAKAICPAYTEQSLALARLDFQDLSPSGPVVDDELVATIYPKLPMLSDWVKLVEARAFDMACKGILPGYKMVEGKRSRSWTDESEAEAVMRRFNKEPFEQKLLSPAKAEKLSKEVKEAIQPYIKSNPGNPCIAPENDKRKAINMAAIDFQSIAKEHENV